MKAQSFRFALCTFGIIAFCLVLSPRPCAADPTAIGPSTSSTLEAASYSYEIPGALMVSGYATGSTYDAGFEGAVFVVATVHGLGAAAAQRVIVLTFLGSLRGRSTTLAPP